MPYNPRVSRMPSEDDSGEGVERYTIANMMSWWKWMDWQDLTKQVGRCWKTIDDVRRSMFWRWQCSCGTPLYKVLRVWPLTAICNDAILIAPLAGPHIASNHLWSASSHKRIHTRQNWFVCLIRKDGTYISPCSIQTLKRIPRMLVITMSSIPNSSFPFRPYLLTGLSINQPNQPTQFTN